jgi:hypothetical protein
MQENVSASQSWGAMGSLVRTMFAGAIVGAASASLLSSASAEARLWDGSLFITEASAQCDAIGEDLTVNGMRALYRPKLKASDPEAAIIFQTYNFSHIYVIRDAKNSTTLNGDGDYCGIDFDPGIGESTTWLGGTYSIQVTPRVVKTATPDVQLSGLARKFGNIRGCTVKFRGAFQRRP